MEWCAAGDMLDMGKRQYYLLVEMASHTQNGKKDMVEASTKISRNWDATGTLLACAWLNDFKKVISSALRIGPTPPRKRKNCNRLPGCESLFISSF